jgi:hypothetical protein
MKRGSGYNPKRRIARADHWSRGERDARAKAASYGGNPEHKLHPNDYGLHPPASPRPGKSLCDAEKAFPKADAEHLLAEGLRRGLVSDRMRGDWPQNVWSVNDGVPFEAQLENPSSGVYHGYPMPAEDIFREIVIREWNARGRTTPD